MNDPRGGGPDTPNDGCRRLGTAVREIAVAAADAAYEDIERLTYEHLAATDLYRSVWIGEYDRTSESVCLCRPFEGRFDRGEVAELIGGNVDLIDRALTEGDLRVTDEVPFTRAAGVTAVGGSAVDPTPSQSGAAVPFVHDGTVYGIAILATSRPSAFGPRERALLEDLGSVVGHALWARRGRRREADARERFAEQVAHELQNSLGAATTHARIARETGDSGSLDRVETALQETLRTIDGLRSMARRTPDLTTRDIAEDARDAWEALDAPEARLVVEGTITVEADRDLLARLFENLFRNAVEHSSTHPGVTVRVGRFEAGNGFYVEDDGPGVPDGEREEVFARGYSTAGGAGIGLALVRDIAEVHGWTVSISEGTDGGARFELSVER